jgi:hypothetical protein
MTENELLEPQPPDDDEVESLGGLAERMRLLWLVGELPTLDELKDWWAALSGMHARLESFLIWLYWAEDEE